jgi:methionine biosynthesis protein MetW
MFRHASANPIPDNWNFDNYDRYWEERIKKGSSEDISYPEIINISDKIVRPGSRVLDIGCGNAAFLSAIKQKKKIIETGIDISSTAVEIAKSLGINARIFNVFKDDFDVLGNFDFVTCFEVLEHIQNSEYLMKLLIEKFPNAEFLFSIPNSGYIYSRCRLLFGRFPKQWHVHPGEHIRFWTKKDFSIILDELGFQIIQIYPASFPFFLSYKYPSLFSDSLIFHLIKS